MTALRQASLFELLHVPYQRVSRASRSGAAAVRPRAGSQAERILCYIEAAGSATRQEIATGLGLGINAVCGRVKSLIDRGLLRVAGHAVGPHGALNEVLVRTSAAPPGHGVGAMARQTTKGGPALG